LIVTAGCGRVQRWGGPIEEIRPGDVIWFPPGEKHWHGAAPATAMPHIAIQEQLDGKVVDWMEKGQRRTISGIINCGEENELIVPNQNPPNRKIPTRRVFITVNHAALVIQS
jgi:hypothetical protein